MQITLKDYNSVVDGLSTQLRLLEQDRNGVREQYDAAMESVKRLVNQNKELSSECDRWANTAQEHRTDAAATREKLQTVVSKAGALFTTAGKSGFGRALNDLKKELGLGDEQKCLAKEGK